MLLSLSNNHSVYAIFSTVKVKQRRVVFWALRSQTNKLNQLVAPYIMFETRGESMQIPSIYGRQINHTFLIIFIYDYICIYRECFFFQYLYSIYVNVYIYCTFTFKFCIFICVFATMFLYPGFGHTNLYFTP